MRSTVQRLEATELEECSAGRPILRRPGASTDCRRADVRQGSCRSEHERADWVDRLHLKIGTALLPYRPQTPK